MPEEQETPRRRRSDDVIDDVLEVVKQIRKDILSLREIITGNGDMEAGLQYRIKQLEGAEEKREKFRAGFVGFLLKVVAPIATIATIGGFIWLATLLTDV